MGALFDASLFELLVLNLLDFIRNWLLVGLLEESVAGSTKYAQNGEENERIDAVSGEQTHNNGANRGTHSSKHRHHTSADRSSSCGKQLIRVDTNQSEFHRDTEPEDKYKNDLYDDLSTNIPTIGRYSNEYKDSRENSGNTEQNKASFLSSKGPNHQVERIISQQV